MDFAVSQSIHAQESQSVAAKLPILTPVYPGLNGGPNADTLAISREPSDGRLPNWHRNHGIKNTWFP